jgi:hypothetical protein
MEQTWLDDLKAEGYCVVRGVLSEEEVEKARAGFWRCIEATNAGVKRDQPDSWNSWNTDHRGIMLDGDLLHCDGAWFLRGHPKVQSLFAQIWKVVLFWNMFCVLI